ncbi:MAG: hypothetical protein ACYSWP_11645 [Planctomycetota bacterium]
MWAIVLSIGVISHWFLDVLVHDPEIPVFFDRFKIGVGLWNYPWTALCFEIILLLLAGYYFLRSSDMRIKYLILIILLIIAYLPMFFAPEAEATPAQASIVSLGLYAVFTGLAYWAERRKNRNETERLTIQ